MCLRASRCQSRILFELTICETSSLYSHFERFFCNANHVLQLFDLVVSCFHLNCDSLFDFDKIEFGLGKQRLRVVDLSFAPAAIKPVVSESDAEGTEVVDQE